jgi:hypothetical protein
MPLFKPFKDKIFILRLSQNKKTNKNKIKTLEKNKIKTLEKKIIKRLHKKFKIKKILLFCSQIFSEHNLTAFKLIIKVKKDRYNSRNKVG